MHRGTHNCTLSEEQCDLWHGWDIIMDHIVATQLPAAVTRTLDTEALTATT